MTPTRLTIVGRGRAGRSFHAALETVGWPSTLVAGRGDHLAALGESADLVLLAVPDHAITDVAQRIGATDAVVAHAAGSRPLTALVPHTRVASIHPLVSLPTADIGARRLRDGAVFAVAGDPIVCVLVDALGGTPIEVADEHRARYHATAAIAANHVVALAAQVERLASTIGVPSSAYLTLMADALDNARESGAAVALTGPVARADWDTVQSHLASLPHDERSLYMALAGAAARLAGHDLPDTIEQEGGDVDHADLDDR